MLRYLLGISLIISMCLLLSAKRIQNTEKLTVLCFHKGHVDTVLLVDSTASNYLVHSSSGGASKAYEIKKKRVFLKANFSSDSSWVKVRYEDEFLVDDIFITAKVLGYNEDYLLIKFDAEQTKEISSVHKSQVAVKDLKRLNLVKK